MAAAQPAEPSTMADFNDLSLKVINILRTGTVPVPASVLQLHGSST
jgi:hypothetical protein